MSQTKASFCLFSSFRTENSSSQRDSNSDRRSGRQERWPLDHHHGPSSILFNYFLITKGRNFLSRTFIKMQRNEIFSFRPRSVEKGLFSSNAALNTNDDAWVGDGGDAAFGPWVSRSLLAPFNGGGSWQGTLTLILKGEVAVRLTSLNLLVRNWLHQEKLRIFFHFQNNLILTSKDEEVAELILPLL